MQVSTKDIKKENRLYMKSPPASGKGWHEENWKWNNFRNFWFINLKLSGGIEREQWYEMG